MALLIPHWLERLAFLCLGERIKHALSAGQAESRMLHFSQWPYASILRVRTGSKVNAVLAIVLICSVGLRDTRGYAAGLKFRADEWVTECETGTSAATPDCSITVPFWQSYGRSKGSFALVIMLQTGNIGIVGEPFPHRAVLRVDKNPPIECRQERYCVFPSMQALAVLKQLKLGSLILIDVYTERGQFSFSLTPKGFQAGIAQIRAWGYQAY